MTRAVLLLACVGCYGSDAPAQVTVRIVSGDGTVHVSRTAHLARTATERRLGLSAHPPLARDEALLMVFPVADEVCIWNGPVDYAIDVVWVRKDRTVSRIEGLGAREEVSKCQEATRWVLELEAGAAAEVTAGDLLEIPPEAE